MSYTQTTRLSLSDLDGIDMHIRIAYPPNMADIDKVFPTVKDQCTKRGIFFAYGNTIYNPSGHVIPIELIAHECVHSLQQMNMPTVVACSTSSVELWWAKYLFNKEFRFEQELAAHQIEYDKYTLDNPGRMFRRRYLAACAERLAGPLYGRLVKKDEAKRLIKGAQP